MKKISLIVILFVFVACQERNIELSTSPTPATRYESCYVDLFGRYYDSLPYNIASLDLFSEGLSLDSTGRIEGSGTNLYISDLFMPSSAFMLQTGEYICDSVPSEYSFLPALSFESNFTGAYLLYIENSSLSSVRMFNRGSLVIEPEKDNKISIIFRLFDADGKEYTAQYSGAPKYKSHTPL